MTKDVNTAGRWVCGDCGRSNPPRTGLRAECEGCHAFSLTAPWSSPKAEAAPTRHKLVSTDLRRMNVPEEFWTATAAGVGDARAPLRNYLKNFDELARQGVGLFIDGDDGVGKTSLAVVLLKAARERMKTGYFVRIGDLRESIKNEHSFDASSSLMDRAREVDYLVLDGLASSDLSGAWLRFEDLQDLVVARGQRGRVTFVTSSILLASLGVQKQGQGFGAQTSTYLVHVSLKGPNRRAAKAAELSKMINSKGKV